MPDPTRKHPYLSVRLYNVGHGDPLCPDEGLGWYDVVEKTWKSGTLSRAANGFAHLECLEGIGLTCRPVLMPKDTALSHFTTSGGAWQEIWPDTGPRVKHLDQYDTAATVTSWSATWQHQHAADPQLAFSLILDDTNSDWDWTNVNLWPFVRIELGGAWGVQFTKDGCFLVRLIGGSWQAVKDLPSPPKGGGYQDVEACWIYFRVLRGQIGISFDFGKSYEWYSPPDGPASVPRGRIVLRGRGGSATFGVHQLKFVAGTFTSHTKTLERARTAATVDFTGSRYDLNGGTVNLADTGQPLARLAQWQATVTPIATTGTLWDFYSAPVLYSVAYDLAPVVQNTGQDHTTPWDDHLLRGKVIKPQELDGSSAEFTFSANADEALDLDTVSYRFRKCELYIGWRMSDDSIEDYQSFTGYIEEISVAWGDNPAKVEVTIKLTNGSARFKRSPWTVFRQFVLSGRTPNQVGDFVLTRKGLNDSYSDWHAAGQYGVIPYGSPEEPNELTPPSELPWETLKRIFDERGLELGVSDDGVIFTLPKQYAGAAVALTVRATPQLAASIWEQARSLGYRIDYKESATCAIAYGTDESGTLALAMTHDEDAETNTASPRFTPLGRETRVKELSGTPTQGYAMGHCQSLAGDSFRVHRDADFVIPMDPTRGRRELVEMVGFEGCGIPDNTQFVLLTLTTDVDLSRGIYGLETNGGIKRLDD